MGSFGISEDNITGRKKKNPQNTFLTATPSREVAQTFASATSEPGLNREVWVALRTGPECSEDNLRELM